MQKSRREIFFLLLAGMLLVTACQEGGDAPVSIPLATQTPLPPEPTPTSISAPPTATPENTPTAPVSSPTPVLNVRLQEDFTDEQSCLETFEQVEGRGGIVDGAYQLQVGAADAIVQARCLSETLGNFEMEADISVLAEPSGGDYYYGFVFRVAGQDRYAFVLGSQGGYCAFYAGRDVYVPFTGSTDFATRCWARPPDEAFQAGSNRLKVVAEDDRLTFYLNDVLVGVVHDRLLREGQIGFMAATGTEGGLVVAFDDLLVKEP
jgi:hypothetical protein